jgi:lysophospholipase L1-like esterase
MFSRFVARALVVLWVLGIHVMGHSAPAAALPFNPQAGETIVFLGDSITHQSLYPQYLENFFMTRYPDRPLRFRNSGVGGDSAADALARFEDDVAVHKPDYVTVHLGMNDGRYAEFDTNTLATYQRGIGELLDRIEAIDAKPILLSPTMFDHKVTRLRATDTEWRFGGKEFSPNYNALLGYFTGWGMETASLRQIPVVNWWAALNRYTTEQRRSKPDFNMIWDAIHPNPSGQLIMVSEILSQLGVEKRSANAITVLRRDSGWTGSKGVTGLRVNDDASEIRFSHRATSLPWVIPVQHSERALKWKLPADGRTGYALANAGHKLSADRLKVAGLPVGRYEVLIDGQPIGIWEHITLGTKIELQENEKTPQYQQALQIAHLNRKRHDECVRPSRDLAGRVKGARRRNMPESNDRITAIYQQVAELNAKADKLLSEIYEAAQPKERQWVIRRVETNSDR